MEEHKADTPAVSFADDVLDEAAGELPISAATWASPSLIRCLAREPQGRAALKFLVTEIANARVPPEIRPLLMDAKLVGLQKGSNMQLG